MRGKVALTAVALLAILPGGASFAAADKFVIDPKHVWVSFSIQHNVWAKTLGVFRDVKGEILFDKDDVAASSVKAEIASTSIDTLDEGRDQEVKFGFLRVDKFPTIVFVSTSVEKTGDNEGNVTGDLTMAGKTKRVILAVVFNAAKASPFDGSLTVGFSATGALNTDDFGIRGLKPLHIGPEVDFRIEVEAIKQ